MKILITICARGGSKGIPGKNIKIIAGKPLVAYSIATANKFANKYDCSLALSTDDNEIKSVCSSYGLSSEYKRPDFLATDQAGKIEVLADILRFEEQKQNIRFDYLLDLDVTSPLRSVEDLEEAFEKIQNNKEALNLFSVSNANKNPYFNMVEQNPSGFAELCKKPTGFVLTRQTAPKVYELNASFYFYRRLFFDAEKISTITDRSIIYLQRHMCFDLDHLIDFEFMTYLIEHNKLDFNL